jgi:hypothetical protein
MPGPLLVPGTKQPPRNTRGGWVMVVVAWGTWFVRMTQSAVALDSVSITFPISTIGSRSGCTFQQSATDSVA